MLLNLLISSTSFKILILNNFLNWLFIISKHFIYFLVDISILLLNEQYYKILLLNFFNKINLSSLSNNLTFYFSITMKCYLFV